MTKPIFYLNIIKQLINFEMIVNFVYLNWIKLVIAFGCYVIFKIMKKTNVKKKWFIIEGNIGSGKSTLLEILNNMPKIETIPEPVDIWLNIKDNTGKNLLQYFYDDMNRNAYMFQKMVFITRCEVLDKVQIKPIRISERSVWTDRYIFGRTCIEDSKMNSIESVSYKYWFDWLESKFKPKPDGIIYVKCSPKKCMERINKRHRNEESTIPFEYLSKLHDYHNEWFDNWIQTPLLILNNEEDNNWDTILKQVDIFINA
jgi:deoxyadenosine/deoxycytidine kinase